MNKDIVCRVAEVQDIPAILKLYSQPEIDDGTILSIAEAEAIFHRTSMYPSYSLFVAELTGQVVGTFALLIMDNIGHLGAPSAIIEAVAVAPAFQKMGIGRSMMNHAFDIAKQNGCYKVTLSAHLKRNDAHKFYESIGFEKHGYSYRLNISPE